MNGMRRLYGLAAAFAAIAASGQMQTEGLPPKEKQVKKRKGNEPKCKSCEMFNSSYACSHSMAMCCAKYKRKNGKH